MLYIFWSFSFSFVVVVVGFVVATGIVAVVIVAVLGFLLENGKTMQGTVIEAAVPIFLRMNFTPTKVNFWVQKSFDES